MDNQTIFDTVVKHFKTQKVPAMDNNGQCRYRVSAKNLNVELKHLLPKELENATLKCAAGVVISDKEYYPNIEGQNIMSLIDRGSIVSLCSENKHLLNRLQHIHDAYGAKGLVTKDTSSRLKTAARNFKLNDSAVTW